MVLPDKKMIFAAARRAATVSVKFTLKGDVCLDETFMMVF